MVVSVSMYDHSTNICYNTTNTETKSRKHNIYYIAPDDVGQLSNTELNITHFYTIPNFLFAIWKDLAELFQKQLVVLEENTFWYIYAGKKYVDLWTQYIFTWWNGQMYIYMTSLKVVHTLHHIHRFLHRSLVIKIHPNPCQTPGTTENGKKNNMAKSEGASF